MKKNVLTAFGAAQSEQSAPQTPAQTEAAEVATSTATDEETAEEAEDEETETDSEEADEVATSSSASSLTVKPSSFEEVIKKYLDAYAAGDVCFAAKYNGATKTVKGCCSWITKQAQNNYKNGNVAIIDDNTVYGMAVHYFEEDSIKEETSAPVAKVGVHTDKSAPTKTKPAPKQKKAAEVATSTAAPAAPAKPSQPNLFDFKVADDVDIFAL